MTATSFPFDNDGNSAIPRPHAQETEYDANAGWVECSLVGDKYYRAMSAWMASRQMVGKAINVYMAGVKYESALNRFLELLPGAPVTSESRLNRKSAKLYKALLTKEIDYLAGQLNTGSERASVLHAVEPWPPVHKPALVPARIDSDVRAIFLEKIAA